MNIYDARRESDLEVVALKMRQLVCELWFLESVQIMNFFMKWSDSGGIAEACINVWI